MPASLIDHAMWIGLILAFLFALVGLGEALGCDALRYRALAILIGLDVLANALTGGKKYHTISCRIGKSIERGGLATKLPWPQWWLEHCRQAIADES